MPKTRSAGRMESPVPAALAFATLADFAFAEGNEISAAHLIEEAYAAADTAEAQERKVRRTATGRTSHTLPVAA